MDNSLYRHGLRARWLWKGIKFKATPAAAAPDSLHVGGGHHGPAYVLATCTDGLGVVFDFAYKVGIPSAGEKQRFDHIIGDWR